MPACLSRDVGIATVRSCSAALAVIQKIVFAEVQGERPGQASYCRGELRFCLSLRRCAQHSHSTHCASTAGHAGSMPGLVTERRSPKGQNVGINSRQRRMLESHLQCRRLEQQRSQACLVAAHMFQGGQPRLHHLRITHGSGFQYSSDAAVEHREASAVNSGGLQREHLLSEEEH